MTNTWPACHILFLVASVCVVKHQAHAVDQCPPRCHCQHRTVSCRNLKLQTIPDGIPLSVEQLYLDDNYLTHVPANAFSALTNLSVLSLTQNEITQLEPGAFNGLQRLKSLFLKQNQLTIVDETVFAGLDALTHIYLSQNELTRIPDVGLAGNLSRITLENNAFSSARFPPGYSKLNRLRSVVLSNNAIKTLNRTDLLSLKSSGITKLYLSRCALQKVANDTFSDFAGLRSLKLSYNEDIEETSIRDLIISLSDSGLVALDLSGVLSSLSVDIFSPLSRVPLRDLMLAHSTFEVISNGTFSQLGNLYHLDLSHGNLKVAEDSAFDGLRSLQRLKLDHNDFHFFPRGLPSSLSILDISYNSNLLSLDSLTFARLDRLTKLSISQCSLRVFTTDSFVGLAGLRTLDLSYNHIGGNNIGAKAFKPMQQLRTLNLEHNKLTTIATEYGLFSNLGNLKKLHLNNNDCRNLSLQLFGALHNLEVLYLHDNDLDTLVRSDIDGVLFGRLLALRELHLERNGLTSLPGKMIQSLASLQNLYLQQNSISTWGDGFFNGTTSIRSVNLTHNKIAYINESSLSGLFGNETRLYLSANPFSCGCDLIWFRNWLDTVNSSEIVIPDLDRCTCSAPVSLAGRPLLSFNPETIMKKCFPPPWLMIIVGAVVACVIIVLVFVAIVYRNRWPLRLRKYRFKRWLRSRRSHDVSREQGVESLPDPPRYDVFVSYGPSDGSRAWVTSVLYPNLATFVAEDRIFFDEKALPNKNVISELADAIYASRRAILVVTSDYLNDTRRIDYEVGLVMAHAASTGDVHNEVILVLRGEDIGEQLPPCLRSLLRCSDLTWPESGTGQNVFWLQLQDKLDFPANNQTPEISSNVPA